MKIKKTFEDLLKEMNERISYNVTTKVVFDKMYQKKVIQFENKKGKAIFRSCPDISNVEFWDEDTVNNAERRYREIYLGEVELFANQKYTV